MGFDAFIGNQKTISRLRAKLREGRFPHALIFSGPEGIGKRTCALMIAKAFNCAQATADDFCGECSHCRKIDSGIHPDVRHIGVEEDASEIKVEQARAVLHTLGLQPLEGRTKVFVIDPMTRINRNAANALLKGLEEPPENSVFILIAENLLQVLPTIRSRSQSHPFTPLTLEEMRSFSSDELALRWSQGSIGRLRYLDMSLLKERRETVLSYLETAVGASPDEFSGLIAASASIARSKQDFETYLDMMTVLLSDLLYLREGVTDKLVNVDIEKRLLALNKQLETGRLIAMGEFLGVVERFTKNYVNKQLMTDVLALTSNAALAKIANDNAAKSR